MKQLRFGFHWLVLVSILIAGCANPCKDIRCQNGDCLGGECVCQQGYEGVSCNTSQNAKFGGEFLGNVFCADQQPHGIDTVNIALEPGTTNQFTLSGLYHSVAFVNASVGSDGYSIQIPRQAFISGLEIEGINGDISVDGRSINLSYKLYGTDTLHASNQCTIAMLK